MAKHAMAAAGFTIPRTWVQGLESQWWPLKTWKSRRQV